MGKPLAKYFFEFLSKLNENSNEYFINIIISFLIYGDVYRKEKKLKKKKIFYILLIFFSRYIRDIEMFVESLGKNFGTNQLIKA